MKSGDFASDMLKTPSVGDLAASGDLDVIAISLPETLDETHKKLRRYTIGVAAITAVFWGAAVYFAVK